MNLPHLLATVATTTALLWLTGCAQVSHVASGEQRLRDKLVVTVDQPWNQFERGLGDNTLTWTQDGITVDALRFYVGLKDGELLAPTPTEPKGEKPLAFKSGMSPQQVVALFEGLYSRGGSSFTLALPRLLRGHHHRWAHLTLAAGAANCHDDDGNGRIGRSPWPGH